MTVTGVNEGEGDGNILKAVITRDFWDLSVRRLAETTTEDQIEIYGDKLARRSLTAY